MSGERVGRALRALRATRLPRVDPWLWLALALSIFALLPLAGPGYFFGAHDAYQSVFFLTQFDSALRDGVWYPGWSTDQAWGYGYPLFVYYSPLSFYVAEVFHVLGAGMVASVKWTWALATAGAGLAMFAFARRVLGRERGLLAAVVYVYMPYHLLDIYVRAALAEYCAFVWMPLVLLAFYRLLEKGTPRRLALAGLVYGALWLTHNITAMAFSLVLIGYILFLLWVRHRPDGEAEGAGEPPDDRKARWLRTLGRAASALGAALLGAGIAAAVILPNLLEQQYVSRQQWVQGGYQITENLVYLPQLLSGFWGYGTAGPGPVDGMSYQLGVVPLVLGLVAVLAAAARPRRERALIVFLAAATGVLVFMVLPPSAALWRVLPMAGLIQFPWRLLALTAVSLSVLAGLAVPGARGEEPDGRAAVLAVTAVLASFAFTLPQYTATPASAEGPLLSIELETKYPDMAGLTAWVSEAPAGSPMVEQYRSGAPLVTAEVLAPGATLEMIRTAGATEEVRVRSAEGTVLRFYTYYFPGWHVRIDGQRLPDSALRPEPPYGLLVLDVPAGEHVVVLRWGDTPVRTAGKALTVVCLVLALGLAVVPGGRRPHP